MTDFSRPEYILMASIHSRYAAAIDAACATSSVPAPFLAALIANESGGNAGKSRFEPRVFGDLCLVCAGMKAHYGSLGAETLLPNAAMSAFRPSMQLLTSLATSWGLTQIMGYQVLPFGKPLTDLLDTTAHLHLALVLVTQFAHQFNLDVVAEFAELFTCWNTGRPDGVTADPLYVPNGLHRALLYAQIARVSGAAGLADGAVTQ